MKLRHVARRRGRVAQLPSKPQPTLLGSFAHMIKFSRLNLLLLVLPIALLAKPFGMSSAIVFLLNFVSIIPLAQLLGVATEEVAIYSNEVIGGLLNATLGNATGRPLPLPPLSPPASCFFGLLGF
jgi:Ca2+:H+ antiporter